MKYNSAEDVETSWYQCETPEDRLEFIESLPSDELNSFFQNGMWPPDPDAPQVIEAVMAHPGLSKITAFALYAASSAPSLAKEEVAGGAPAGGKSIASFLGEKEVAVVQALRDRINAGHFADVVYPHQAFASPLEWFIKENSVEKFGSYAISDHAVLYVIEKMEADTTASQNRRFILGEGPVDGRQALSSWLMAFEDRDSGDALTKTGRAAIWIRKKLGIPRK